MIVERYLLLNYMKHVRIEKKTHEQNPFDSKKQTLKSHSWNMQKRHYFGQPARVPFFIENVRVFVYLSIRWLPHRFYVMIKRFVVTTLLLLLLLLCMCMHDICNLYTVHIIKWAPLQTEHSKQKIKYIHQEKMKEEKNQNKTKSEKERSVVFCAACANLFMIRWFDIFSFKVEWREWI